MSQSWKTLADLGRLVDADRHETGRSFLEVAARQAAQKRISEADLKLIQKLYGREALQNLTTEEYVEMRRSGRYEELERKFELTGEEASRAEAAIRKAGAHEIVEWQERGFMPAEEARKLLSQVTSVDRDASDEDAFKSVSKTLEKDGDLAPSPDSAAFERNMRRAGVDTRALSPEQLAEHRDDFENLSLLSSGLPPKQRQRKIEHELAVDGEVYNDATEQPAPEAA